MTCWHCHSPLGENGWLMHRPECDRALLGQCECAADSRWLCERPGCIQNRKRGYARNRLNLSSLVLACRAAHDATVALFEDMEEAA